MMNPKADRSVVRALRTALALVFALAVLNAAAGAQYLFTDQQSGWVLKPKEAEVGAAFGSVSLHIYGETGHIWNIYGVNLGVGVARGVELRVRYGYLDVKNATGASVVSFGPKIGLWRDILAIDVPVEVALGKNVETSRTWNIQPGLIASIPIGKSLEITPSAKALVPLYKGPDADTLVAVNLGLGIFATVKKNLVIRPEVGLLFDPGNPGTFYQFGIGISYRTRPKA
jgi:hypothetical protein